MKKIYKYSKLARSYSYNKLGYFFDNCEIVQIESIDGQFEPDACFCKFFIVEYFDDTQLEIDYTKLP